VFGAVGDTFALAGLRADDESEVWWMVFYHWVPALVVFTPPGSDE
jgi:hypothetical protein